jgi:23S rRNA (uridine2552-2'-O)-methyltransferase
MRRSRAKLRRGRRLKPSSERWLRRQLKDPFVAAAREAGYRSRAAWKLVEIDDRFRLFRPKARVVDLGAAPGGWTQVALARCPGGRVVAVDRAPMAPVDGAIHLELDILDAETPPRIREALGAGADIVLSDMAPPATGHRTVDHARIMHLAEAAFAFAETVLEPGGILLIKVLKGGTENIFFQRLKPRFAVIRHVKPPASRAESAESYILAMGFKGRALAKA